jgi:hypothetical protein
MKETYEELFWTWKLKTDELRIKSLIIFKHFLLNGNVTYYQTYNVAENDYYVEFPSSKVYYDRLLQKWRTKE